MKHSDGIFWAPRLLAAAVALSACGGTNPAPPVLAHGTLDLSQALPAPTPTPFPAFGARQPGSRDDVARDAQTAIAPYLKAERSRVVRTPVGSPAAAPARRRDAVSASSPQALPAAVARGAAEADDPRLIASNSESLGLDADRYAERQSRKAETYRGGDAIVIGAGTLLLVLLIVLLVVLLT